LVRVVQVEMVVSPLQVKHVQETLQLLKQHQLQVVAVVVELMVVVIYHQQEQQVDQVVEDLEKFQVDQEVQVDQELHVKVTLVEQV
jgi:pyruvate-formate lyase-activating enzyme